MKKLLLIIVAVLCTQFVLSQTPDSVKTVTDTTNKSQTVPATAPEEKSAKSEGRSFNEKFAFGFGGGFWTNSYSTYIEVAPSVAYRFPKMLITGVGFRYIYQHVKEVNNDLNAYGPNVFARLNVHKKVYLWTEYEILQSQYFVPDQDNPFSNNLDRETDSYDSWFAGIGLMQSVGKKGRGGISVQVLYNFLYDDDEAYNPYYSAWTYRIGYFF